MNHIKPLVIVSVILISAFILTSAFNSIPLSKFTNIQTERHFSSKPNHVITEVLSSPYNTTFLPNTNLSVTRYVNGDTDDSANVSVSSLDRSFWYVHCNNFDNDTRTTFSFNATVNRTSSAENFYEASNYYNWDNVSQPVFDYWINSSNFYPGYELETSDGNLTVEGSETITMQNLGEFNVWKLSGVFGGGFFIVTARYEVNTGMFICTQIQVILDVWWYNLTRVDFGQVQQGYNGPTLSSLFPINDTVHPNGTIINFEFYSPYDVHRIYFQWDLSENSSIQDSRAQTSIPYDNGIHHLYVLAIDSLGYKKTYHFVYETNRDFPGIFLLNFENNTRIQGLSQIIISISNGNGSIIYNWNEPSNTTVPEGTPIIISNLEDVYVLNVYAKSDKLLWSYKRFIFIVDNTPTSFVIYNPKNNSVIKGMVDILVAVSEKSNITYKLNNKPLNYIIAETGLNYTISFTNLINGSYELNFTVYDEARNPTKASLHFYIYSSAFNWNWNLYGNKTLTLDIVDASETTWFYLTVLSKTNQNFNLTVLQEQTPPSRTEDMEYIIQFLCDQPEDLVFMNFVLPLNNSDITDVFDVYKWVYWNNQNGTWQEMTTSYNAISHSWEATYEGGVKFFALIKTGEITELKSIQPGGGQIPGFTGFVVITSFITYCIILKKKNRNN